MKQLPAHFSLEESNPKDKVLNIYFDAQKIDTVAIKDESKVEEVIEEYKSIYQSDLIWGEVA